VRAARPLILTVGVLAWLIGAAPSAFAAPPGNDDFGSAIEIGGLPFADSLSTVEATTQADDPLDCIGDASNSVWYSYTSDLDGFVAFETYGSDFDTVLSAFTGTQGALTQVACNDDSVGLQSRIKWAVTPATTYHVMVSGFFGASGNVLLNAHAEPPFSFEVAVSGRGSVDEVSGDATIRGTVVCSIPGIVFTEGGRLRQQVGEFKVRAFPDGGFECGPEMRSWDIQATPLNGLFVRGKARLIGMVWHGYSSDFNEQQLQTDQPTTIRLRR
jgi:hypothetical protein